MPSCTILSFPYPVKNLAVQPARITRFHIFSFYLCEPTPDLIDRCVLWKQHGLPTSLLHCLIEGWLLRNLDASVHKKRMIRVLHLSRNLLQWNINKSVCPLMNFAGPSYSCPRTRSINLRCSSDPFKTDGSARNFVIRNETR